MLNLHRLTMTHHAGQVQLPGQVRGAAFLGSLFTKKGVLKKFKARVRAKAKGKGKAKPAADAPAAGASAEFPPAAGASEESEPAAEAPAASASEEPAPAAEARAASASGESEPAAKAPAASASGESEPAAEAPAEQTKKAKQAKAKGEPKGKAKAKAKAVASVAAADAEVPSAVEADVKPSAVETPTAPSVVFCGWCNLPCEMHCGRYTTKSQHSQTSCLLLYMTTHSHPSRYQHRGTHRVHSLIYDRTLITNMIKHFIDFQSCLQLLLYMHARACRNSFSQS